MYTLRINTKDSKLIIRKTTAKIKVGASVKRGLQGVQGPKGDKGDIGPKGDKGDDGVIQSIVAGDNVSVDNSDPANPVISASGGGGGGGAVDSVNGQTGVVVLDADDIDDTSTTHKFVTSGDLTKLSNLSGTNSGDVTVSDSSEIDLTLSGQQISASIKSGSVDETKLDTSVNASLDLADTSVQPGDDVSDLNNDAGYTTNTGTVTSVAVSGSDGIEVDSGSPVTTNGTIALGVNKSTLLSHINVEDGADVTDATNVAAAGAVMEADTSTASMSFVIDEDDMASNSATKVPTQQSVKAYVDASGGGGGGGAVIVPGYTLPLHDGVGLLEYTSGSYTPATFGNNGMGTYMGVAGGPNVRQEIYKSARNGVARLRGLSLNAVPYVSAGTTLQHETFVGYGPVGSGNATADINYNADNFGFRFVTNLDNAINVYAVNGDGMANTQTLIQTVAAATEAYHVYSITNDGTTANFYVDGTLSATHTTNISSSTDPPYRGFTWFSQKKAGNASVYQSIDLYDASFSLL